VFGSVMRGLMARAAAWHKGLALTRRFQRLFTPGSQRAPNPHETTRIPPRRHSGTARGPSGRAGVRFPPATGTDADSASDRAAAGHTGAASVADSGASIHDAGSRAGAGHSHLNADARSTDRSAECRYAKVTSHAESDRTGTAANCHCARRRRPFDNAPDCASLRRSRRKRNASAGARRSVA
jgi:hypothetical protein